MRCRLDLKSACLAPLPPAVFCGSFSEPGAGNGLFEPWILLDAVADDVPSIVSPSKSKTGPAACEPAASSPKIAETLTLREK